MKIVIDSNVWISALVFGGNPRKIFERSITDGWTVVVSEEILTEVRRTLHSKFADFVDDFESFYAILLPRISKVPLGSVHVNASRDPDDNRVIETAIIGRVSHIITGDKDVLMLGQYKDVAIVSPTDFLNLN